MATTMVVPESTMAEPENTTNHAVPKCAYWKPVTAEQVAKLEEKGITPESNPTAYAPTKIRCTEEQNRTVAEFRKANGRFPNNYTLLDDEGPKVQTNAVLIRETLPAPAWPKVTPVADDLSQVDKFNPEFLPESIRPWIQDVSERMSVPLDFAAVCALVTLSGVIGRRAFVYPKAHDKGWKESVSLSGAVVAYSGKVKTPTWKTFLNPVIEVEMDWKREYEKASAIYQEQQQLWDKAESEREKSAKKGAPVVVPQGAPPQEPEARRRLLLNDATPEKMHDVMRNNPEGLLYYRDELSSWVAELDKEGREAQRGLFLAAMNGNDAYSVDRIGRDGGHAIMCASVFGGFQPELLKSFLNKSVNVDDGTIPRFTMLVWPDEIDMPLIDRPENTIAKSYYQNAVRAFATMKAESVQLHFSPEAQTIFDGWLVKIRSMIARAENTGVRSHLAKYNGALPKLAALLQLIDLVNVAGPAVVTSVNLETGKTEMGSQKSTLSGNHVIDAEHLNKAVRLLMYLGKHMERVYGCIQEPAQKAETLLAQRLKERQLRDGFSVRDITRKCWSHLSKPDIVESALQGLEDKGWIRLLPITTNVGRPTSRWEINPEV
jgi:putative DNA primase/helicase